MKKKRPGNMEQLTQESNRVLPTYSVFMEINTALLDVVMICMVKTMIARRTDPNALKGHTYQINDIPQDRQEVSNTNYFIKD